MSAAASKRGALIVLEGCDRAGKSTQCKLLVKSLAEKGVPVQLMNFPDRSTLLGKVIDNYLKSQNDLPDKAIHLLFSANRWELEPKMNSLLKDGVTLIVDRYVYSGVAFSAAKKGMDLDWCTKPETGLPKPDTVFFLDLSPEASAKRGGFGGERYETSEFQKLVHGTFLKLKADNWQMIDADKDKEDLHQELLTKTLMAVEKVGDLPLQRLW